MKTRCSRFILGLAAIGTLGACGTDTLPPTNTAGPTATYTTQPAPAYVTQPTTTQQVVTTTTTTSPGFEGTLIGPPGSYTVMPSSGSSTFMVAPMRLNANDIVAVISGNTASGTTADGQPYYTKFQRSGGMIFHEGSNFVANGNWRVTGDGQLCSSLVNVNFGTEQCYTLYRNGVNGYVYERPDGHPVGNFVVSPGA
jgi:hypothetical protein